MTFDAHSFVIRRPRHAASDDPQVRIWLEEDAGSGGLRRDVQLVDFSRKGAKLELAGPMTPAADVQLHVEHPEANLSVTLPATVGWQRRLGEGHWLLGCVFSTEVSYEMIGEMFLSGVLDMHARPH